MRPNLDQPANARALVEFWRQMAENGPINQLTAVGILQACKAVLKSVYSWDKSELEKLDVRTLNVEATLERFQESRKFDLKPETVETYKGRFRFAVTSFLSFLDDPANWEPDIAERGGRATRGAGAAAAVIEHRYPLRDGLDARLILPRDHWVRLDTCDYSVHPSAIGQRVEVIADLDRVRVRRGGVLVGEHERCWARHQTITDDEHRKAADIMRQAFQGRTPAQRGRADDEVQQRKLADYDQVLGTGGDDTDEMGQVA